MTGRIDLLGIGIDLYDTDEAYIETCKALARESLSLVYLVDTKACMEVVDSESLTRVLETADIVLPADESTESGVINILGHTKGRVFVDDYFDRIFATIEEESREIFIITDTEEQLNRALTTINIQRQYLSIRGDSVENIGVEQYELIANVINSVAPDVLILCVSHKMQAEFLASYRTQINVNLCICTGRTLLDMLYSRAEMPSFIKKFRLENIYSWFSNKKKIHTTVSDSIFKKRIKKEKNKKI